MDEKIIKQFKITLEERLQTLQNNISIANDSILEINRQKHGDEGDAITANTQGTLDLALISQYEVETKMIENSLQKIQNGTFGICEMCGDDINEQRLWVKPHAQYCIICREIYEKNQ